MSVVLIMFDELASFLFRTIGRLFIRLAWIFYDAKNPFMTRFFCSLAKPFYDPANERDKREFKTGLIELWADLRLARQDFRHLKVELQKIRLETKNRRIECDNGTIREMEWHLYSLSEYLKYWEDYNTRFERDLRNSSPWMTAAFFEAREEHT